MKAHLRTIVLLTGIVSVGCSPSLKPASEVLSTPPFSESKVEILASAVGASPKEAQPSFVTGELGYANYLLPRGTALTVTFDQACASQTRSNLWLQLDGDRQPASLSEYSAEWVLPEDLRARAIKALADSDPCLVSISQSEQVLAASDVLRDPRLRLQRQLHETQLLESFAFFQGKLEEVVIAVVDSGIDFSHEDLASRKWTNSRGESGYDFYDGRAWHTDTHGHGTTVAGLIAAQNNNRLGISSPAGFHGKLMSVRGLGGPATEAASGTTANVVNAIQFAVDNGADVINLSLGAPGWSRTQEAALRKAVSSGAFVVAASGNRGFEISDRTPYTPAIYAAGLSGMVAVGAIDLKSGLPASFSNYSATRVEIGAPGAGGVYTTMMGNGYNLSEGTSLAAPMVSGAAALVIGYFRSQGSEIPPDAVEEVLLRGSQSVKALKKHFKNGTSLNYLALSREIAGMGNLKHPPVAPKLWVDAGITNISFLGGSRFEVTGFICNRDLHPPEVHYRTGGANFLWKAGAKWTSDFIWNGECLPEHFMLHTFTTEVSSNEPESIEFYMFPPGGEAAQISVH